MYFNLIISIYIYYIYINISSLTKLYKGMVFHQILRNRIPFSKGNSTVKVTGRSPFYAPGTRYVYSTIPIGSMYGIFTYIWLRFMVNVGKYTIHGSYGIFCGHPKFTCHMILRMFQQYLE